MRDIFRGETTFTNGNLQDLPGNFYTAGYNNVIQSIAGYLYQLPKTIATVYTASSSTIVFTAMYNAISPLTTITLICREIASGEAVNGTYISSFGNSSGDLISISTTVNIGFNWIEGTYIKDDTTPSRITVYLSEEFA